MAKYKRIGHYDTREDIINLANSSRDEIVDHMKSGLGHFHKSENEEVNFNDFDLTTISGNDGDEYIIQSSIATQTDLIGKDDFIDIYEKVKKR